jgi:hypothetical protein
MWDKLRSAFKSDPERPRNAKDSITVVSGLPRSGTSMMMKMLDAGGIPPLTDEIREADTDNPKGYYEFERVKQLNKGDTAWLPDAQGKAVKVIAALLEHLPPDYNYRVIFMQRQLGEILRSQKQMLIRRGESTDKVSDEEIAVLFQKHVDHITSWLAEQPNFDVVYISYNRMLEAPSEQVARIDDFLGNRLDVEKSVAVVDPTLYRQRQN